MGININGLNEEWIRRIDSIEAATRKYVLVYEDIVLEADNEQDIMARLYRDYIETDSREVQLLFRIDLARALSMWSISKGLNVEIMNGKEIVKENYAASDKDPDYEKDYEKADVIIDVENELSMFKGINEIGYANIYYRNESNKYIKF
ncbi:MAG: hypothetical protein SOY04_08690 [Clostridium celatum]|nr:hypothetical protein [Clostridium celatum]